jgi:lipoate synthase
VRQKRKLSRLWQIYARSTAIEVTIGQYMRPSLEHLLVQKYWTPAEFSELGEIAQKWGFLRLDLP